MPTAKSLILAAGSAALYTTRYVTQRIHRKLDERDNLLRDAVYKLENQSLDEWPQFITLDVPLDAGAQNYTLTAKHLTNSAEKASCIAFEGEDQEITFTAIVPGEQTFAITLTESASDTSGLGAACTTTWDGSTLAITVASDATNTTLVSALGSDGKAKYLVAASVTGTAATDLTAQLGSAVSLTMADGEGEVFALYAGGVLVELDDAGSKALGITSFSESTGTTTVEFDIPAAELTQDNVASLRAECNGVAVVGLSHVVIS